MILSAERRRSLTAKAQGLASHADQAMPYLMSRGISREVADMFQLGFAVEGEFTGRLSIPYVTPAGVVQIKYRCANEKHADHKDVSCPKYLYESGCGVHLYNAQVLITAADMVVVTEGELDAICVQAYCGIPAVAYPGTETWQKQSHWRLCFEGVGEVVVVCDGDDPGRAAARKVAESIGYNARVLDLPDGHDANSYLAAMGAGVFLERLAA